MVWIKKFIIQSWFELKSWSSEVGASWVLLELRPMPNLLCCPATFWRRYAYCPMLDYLIVSGWLTALRKVGLTGPFGLSAIGKPVFWSIAILRVFSCLLARPSSLAAVTFLGLAPMLPSFFNSFTLSAYLSVFNVCSEQFDAGEMLAIMVVLLFPINESLRTCVNLEPRNGVCFLSRSSARMHSLRAKRDLLISAPSIFVYLSVCIVSAPLSLPAKSMKLILL